MHMDRPGSIVDRLATVPPPALEQRLAVRVSLASRLRSSALCVSIMSRLGHSRSARHLGGTSSRYAHSSTSCLVSRYSGAKPCS